MATKRDKRGRKRNYKKEYKRDQGTSKDIKDRSSRNRARLLINCKGNEVEHKDGNPRNNKRSNLLCVSKKKNTTKSNKKRARKR